VKNTQIVKDALLIIPLRVDGAQQHKDVILEIQQAPMLDIAFTHGNMEYVYSVLKTLIVVHATISPQNVFGVMICHLVWILDILGANHMATFALVRTITPAMVAIRPADAVGVAIRSCVLQLVTLVSLVREKLIACAASTQLVLRVRQTLHVDGVMDLALVYIELEVNALLQRVVNSIARMLGTLVMYAHTSLVVDGVLKTEHVWM